MQLQYCTIPCLCLTYRLPPTATNEANLEPNRAFPLFDQTIEHPTRPWNEGNWGNSISTPSFPLLTPGRSILQNDA